MKRIIHMSDLHVGASGLGFSFQAVVDALIAGQGKEAGEYVIVITGDLVDDANVDGLYEAVKGDLDRLRAGGFEHVLVVPGNHDYGAGSLGNKRFVPLFKQAFYGAEVTYPKTDIIDDVAFIGLDSVANELHWYDELWAQGEMGAEQLARVADVLRSSDVRACQRRVLYFHHHPFDWRPLHQLKDARKLRRVLRMAAEEGVVIDCLLCGHNHAGNAHPGGWGIPRCYDAGSATQKARGRWTDWVPCYRIHAATRVIDLADARFDHVLAMPVPPYATGGSR